jgi:signal transduction histidine kinase
LIDAAILIADAPTARDAFHALAETGARLLGADELWLVAWDDDLTGGQVVAAAGGATSSIGARVSSSASLREALESDEPHVGPPVLDGLPAGLAERERSMATNVRVPLLTESCRTTVHCSWVAELDHAEASEAAQLLEKLARLTTRAQRTQAQRVGDLNRETLTALFDAVPTAMIVADPETDQIVAANRAFCELVDRPLGEILATRPPYPWWGVDDERPGRGFVPGTSIDRVYRLPDGRPVPAHLSVHAIRGDDGEPTLILALIEDLAEERRMQQQLVQSGKLAAIGELAAGVAHEINNPLFAILGLTEFLLKESEAGSKAHTRLELIHQTGLEIKEIVRALLDFARENTEERRIVSLDDVVRSTVDLVRRTNSHKGVELVDDYEGTDVLVNASPNQLKQVFLNLIANARQAMPDGGTVSLSVRRVGDRAIATVADDGPGIDPAVAERIFEPFFTTRRLTGGTGLGLSVSVGIAEAQGGRLTVASEPGAGATFTLCLPVADEDPE